VIDDDVGVMRTLQDDLGRRFGEDFRVIAESSAGFELFHIIGLPQDRGTHEPRTQWLPEAIQFEGGYILTGRDIVRDGAHPSRWPLDRAPFPLETSMPGVFAVGDARYRSIKRVASAVGDGATAVRLAHEYLTTGHADELSLTPHG
jgi:hypothetical protein